MNKTTAHLRCTGSACLKKARCLLLALQPTGPDLVLMLGLEVLLWTA